MSIIEQSENTQMQTAIFDDNSNKLLKHGNTNTTHRLNGSNTLNQNGNTKKVENGFHNAIKNSSNPTAVFMKLRTYLSAVRPWSFSASLVPTLLGLALAYRTSTPHSLNFLTFILIIFTVLTVHGAGNVVNTYFDYVKGIDDRKSDDRTLVDCILSKDEVNKFIIFPFRFTCIYM